MAVVFDPTDPLPRYGVNTVRGVPRNDTSSFPAPVPSPGDVIVAEDGLSVWVLEDGMTQIGLD